jgi:hypothetical protein
MLQYRAVPQANTSLFSIPGAGKSWASYSWLFELLIFQLFQRLGLVGIVAYATGFAVVITMALYRLIRNLQADFAFAVLLTFVASYSLYRLYTPRPWLFSILFFVLELNLLMQARKNGKLGGLLWLPVIFAFWANLHIQFINGLVVLAIALAEAVLARRWTDLRTRIGFGWMWGVTAACIVATLANPYGCKIYKIAYDLAVQPGVVNNVGEFQSLPFRSLDDWLILFLALASVSALAKARRVVLFESVLLVFAIYVAFRSQRDLWVLVCAASAILAAGLKGNEADRLRPTLFAMPMVGLTTALVVMLGFRVQHVDNARLRSDLALAMPVRAVEVIEEKGWGGPLYNEFNWGGYLIWALRMPVEIDGRAALYGDERIDRTISTWSGKPEWASDPDLAKAGLVIGPVQLPLTQLLRMDPRFQLVYEDKLAAVFVARKNLSSAAATTPAAVGGADHQTVK